MRGSAFIAVAAVCAATATASATAAAPPARPCAGADHAPSAASVARARAAIACLIDAARAQRGLPALRRDAHLRTAAQRYARALDPRRPLTHEGAGGSTPLERVKRAGYGGGAGFSASETLGRGAGDFGAPATRVQTWLKAAVTRRTLLGRAYRDVGVGVVVRGGVTTYVVELAAVARKASASSKRASGSSSRSPSRSRSWAMR